MNKIADIDKRFEKIKYLKDRFIKISAENITPLYLFDKEEAKINIALFKNAFKKAGVNVSIFFATKSNPYKGLLNTVVDEGEGLDVSSQRELKLAISAGAKKIIYTGPAKTKEDFDLILKYNSMITVNLESLRELLLLAKMAKAKKLVTRCGVRIHSKIQAGWTKFGISLEELKGFFDEAKKHPSINFCGIHFHISHNKSPDKYINTFKALSKYFNNNFTDEERTLFEYIDMGGGFYPKPFEALYAWNPKQETTITNFGDILKDIIADKFKPRYLPIDVDDISVFAYRIVDVFNNVVLPTLPNVSLYAEPGRFIAHSTMHFLLKLYDIKNNCIGITDGGNNMVGWEKHQFFEYTPLINLSQFDNKREIPFITYGSLCTPDDIWGYYLYTKSMPKEGDILCMPFQGAYTYTLAQNFIKDIPKVYDL